MEKTIQNTSEPIDEVGKVEGFDFSFSNSESDFDDDNSGNTSSDFYDNIYTLDDEPYLGMDPRDIDKDYLSRFDIDDSWENEQPNNFPSIYFDKLYENNRLFFDFTVKRKTITYDKTNEVIPDSPIEDIGLSNESCVALYRGMQFNLSYTDFTKETNSSEKVIMVSDILMYSKSTILGFDSLSTELAKEIFETIRFYLFQFIDGYTLEEYKEATILNDYSFKDGRIVHAETGAWVRDVSISNLPFNTHARNCLDYSGISRISELLLLTERDLHCIHNLGKKTAENVLSTLSSYLDNNRLASPYFGDSISSHDDENDW